MEDSYDVEGLPDVLYIYRSGNGRPFIFTPCVYYSTMILLFAFPLRWLANSCYIIEREYESFKVLSKTPTDEDIVRRIIEEKQAILVNL